VSLYVDVHVPVAGPEFDLSGGVDFVNGGGGEGGRKSVED